MNIKNKPKEKIAVTIDGAVLSERLCMILTGSNGVTSFLNENSNQKPEEFISYLLDSEDCRNRFREASYTDENAVHSLELWPPLIRDYKLQIVIITKDGWSKCETVVDYFLSNMPDNYCLTVIAGKADPLIRPCHPRFELHVVEGKNVHELRALIPVFLKECEWVSCLEDHAPPVFTWIAEVHSALESMPSKTLAFTGVSVNLTSRSDWSWASFLFNFLDHWHPCVSLQLTGSVGTTFFRRDILGSDSVPLYYIENKVFGREMPVVDKIQINHTQHMSVYAAIYHNYINGIASGAAMRLSSIYPGKSIYGHIKKLLIRRVFTVQGSLMKHPCYSELPKATCYRVSIIAVVYCVGYATGALLGPFNSYAEIE